MASLLQKIIKSKKIAVENDKKTVRIAKLEHIIIQNNYKPNSLAKALIKQPGIIAEFKRASPSKGVINHLANPKKIISKYDKGGATGISVLTDVEFFKAQKNDFAIARATTNKPILRKDFIIDIYQIYQSKAMGANVILLIASVLSKIQIAEFTKVAQQLGLEVFVEIHDEFEIEKLSGHENIIGINNRNLKTFEVNINNSILLKKKLGNLSIPLISESGLKGILEIEKLLEAGFRGFLMGEFFMKQHNLEKVFTDFNFNFKNLIKQL